MTIKWKVSIIISAIVLVAACLVNLSFLAFFQEYVTQQETDKVSLIKESVDSSIGERLLKYRGSANDWGHWDDFYEYMGGVNADFIERNVTNDTFLALDLSFIMVIRPDDTIQYMATFDGQDSTAFPDVLLPEIAQIVSFSHEGDGASGLLPVGGDIYFIAVSDITDSDSTLPANGRLVFGHRFDSGIIQGLEQTVNCKIELTAAGQVAAAGVDGNLALENYRVDDGDRTMTINLLYSKYPQLQDSIRFTLQMDRDIYRGAMLKIRNFMDFFTAGFLIVSLLIFMIMGIYMSKPITSLINDVKKINLNKGHVSRIKEVGNNEWTFLRRSINRMLAEIDAEQNEVQESKEKLQITLSSVADGVIAVNRDCLVDYLNPAAEQLTGWTLAEAAGQPVESVFRVYQEHFPDRVLNPASEVIQSGNKVELADNAILLTRDGQERAVEDTAAPIRDQAGEIIGCVIVFHDNSEKKEKHRQIEYLSYHDQLTGLYNRRFFEEELRRLDTGRNLPITLLFADINGLKTINDGFGHYYGDLLISQFADVLKKTCRMDDIIARTGGDEFVILLPHTDAEGVQKLVARIKDKVDQVKILDITLSVSFGWDTKTTSEQAIQDVLKKSEDLMYQKKILSSYSKRSGIIKYILKSLLIKSPRENAHSKRVSEICCEIGQAYNLSDDEIRELRVAGELHDIGKIAVDVVILNKAGPLTDDEWDQIKAHPETGYRLLGSSLEYHTIARSVLAHHERWDGGGYPNNLAGEAIDWKARVIALADAYDAMTSERPYRRALSEDEAVLEIKAMAGLQFDPDIVRTFVTKILHRRW